MEWIIGIQNAINYIEENIGNKIDYSAAAKKACCSESNFMRVFSVLSGYTVGEYVRCRRLALAGQELAAGTARVIDVALKYGYDSPESFTRAFVKFHGITPSEARRKGSKLRSFSSMTLKILIEGGRSMEYKIEEKPCMIFVGFKRGFDGKAEERFKQDEEFWMSTRKEQNVLSEMRLNGDERWFEISTDFTENGFTQYISVLMEPDEGQEGMQSAFDRLKEGLYTLFDDEWADKIFENVKAGIPIQNRVPDTAVKKAISDFDIRVVPAHTYAVFRSEEMEYPTMHVNEFRHQIISEWLPASGYTISDFPEIVMMSWFMEKKEKRFMEIWLPVESQ